jgi:hypothetical protein
MEHKSYAESRSGLRSSIALRLAWVQVAWEQCKIYYECKLLNRFNIKDTVLQKNEKLVLTEAYIT